MQLGQNSTEAVVARACDFYKQYVMFDIIAWILLRATENDTGNGKITSCAETGTTR
jgi:hypothetical protein